MGHPARSAAGDDTPPGLPAVVRAALLGLIVATPLHAQPFSPPSATTPAPSLAPARAPAPAPEIVSAADPRQILESAKGFGSATLDTDADGDPHISGRIDGIKYGITFYGCHANANCDEIQYHAAWAGKRPPLPRLNEWNRKKLFGRVYLDAEGDLTVDALVSTQGGISRTALETSMEDFQAALQSLLVFFDTAGARAGTGSGTGTGGSTGTGARL